jgi:transcriptional regulator with XRE-family HTH domain
MAKKTSEERKARDAAFDDLMASVNPVFALKREMKIARTRAGLSQRELAKRMRTTQAVIARLERGLSSPNIKTLRKLAEATGSRLVIRLEAVQVPQSASVT